MIGVARSQPGRHYYKLPQPLIDAFIHIVMWLVLGAHALSSNNQPAGFQAFHSNLETHGQQCRDYLQNAKYNLMSMTHMGKSQDEIAHEAVGGEAILAIVLENLSRDISIDGSFEVTEVYKRYTARLVSVTP